jgi:8-amino-7-oxononanoate synthase
MAALEVVAEEPHRRTELLTRAAELRGALCRQGWKLGTSDSQIIPIIVGTADRAVALAGKLRKQGFFVPAIRPPTVPEGEACLRISLTWLHAPATIESLVAALGQS